MRTAAVVLLLVMIAGGMVCAQASVYDATAGQLQAPDINAQVLTARPTSRVASAPPIPVLWDLTHGVYLGYEPSQDYSSLVSMLAGEGFAVQTTAAGVNNVDLSQYKILVICLGSGWYSAYGPAEVAAIETFVQNGGGLLIMGENTECPNGNINPVAQAFGATCGVGYLQPLDLPFTNWLPHPIFAGCATVFYRAAGGLSAVPPASIVAWPNPPVAGTVAISSKGAGLVAIVGDGNFCDNGYLLTNSNPTFTKNLFHWLAEGGETPAPVLLQAYAGNSGGASQHQMGYLGGDGDTAGSVPGVFSIVPGINWSNFVKAAQARVGYTLKNVVLKKQTPVLIQCADVFPAKTVSQQGTPNIRLWWPLMYEAPGTTWTLSILYGTPTPFDDDGDGPNPPAYVHTDVWTWKLEATLESMKSVVDLYHQIPFGLDEVPVISDEVLYATLQQKLDGVIILLCAQDIAGAGLKLGEFEMMVMDACIVTSPSVPKPTGPGTGIANSLENPACCKLLIDAEYVGFENGIFLPAK